MNKNTSEEVFLSEERRVNSEKVKSPYYRTRIFGSGIGIFPALCASRLASLVARVGENSHPGLFSSAKQVLLPPGSNPYIILNKKRKHPVGYFLFWQRDRDSNPNKQSQSLSCYRYTIPLGREILYYYNFRMSIVYSNFFRKFFN